MAQQIGVLLLQTGTPDSPTPESVRGFLERFLSDRRVIEDPPSFWFFILYLGILPFRCGQSAGKYKRIWDEKTGSPLYHYTHLQATKLQKALPPGYVVRFAMRYSTPTIPEIIRSFADYGVERVLLLPMFPQYSATTTASALDEAFRAFTGLRVIPSIRIVPPYYDHPAYIEALSRLISEIVKDKPDLHKLVLSFHGIPKAYAEKGDPYPIHCHRTYNLVRQRLPIDPDKVVISFQSRFGKKEWLKPYTDELLIKLAHDNHRHVWIAAPGFTADCLETIEELGKEAAAVFQKAGGLTLTRIRCLNDHPAWIEGLKTIVLEQSQGWVFD